MLMLSGDQDGGAPTDAIEDLERGLGAVSALHERPGDFRGVVSEMTGHESRPEMKAGMLSWIEKHPPAGE
jgi:ABC-type sugar transport system substrate-binding protein